MTLLSIVSNAAMEMGLTSPSYVIGNTDETVVQLLALSNRAGKELASCYNWTDQTLIYTFDTVNGTPAYAFPADFDRFINDTQWNRSTRLPMSGPISPQVWEYIKSGFTVSGPLQRFRVYGSDPPTLYIDPTPTGVGTIAFEYLSAGWCRATGSVPYTIRTAWAVDTDVGLLSEDLMTLSLIYRYRARKGLSYDEEYNDYDTMLKRLQSRDGGAPTLSLSSRGGFPMFMGPWSIPDGNWNI